jgi:hypothetical protein
MAGAHQALIGLQTTCAGKIAPLIQDISYI